MRGHVGCGSRMCQFGPMLFCFGGCVGEDACRFLLASCPSEQVAPATEHQRSGASLMLFSLRSLAADEYFRHP